MSDPWKRREVIVDAWAGCYADGWKGEICDASFAHPAKVSRALIRRIYEHAFAEGWLVPGSVVVDPFGGICGCGLDAALRGVRFVGVELEPKFGSLGNDNIKLWQRKYSGLARWTSPMLVQGDSRKLSEVIGRADLVCSSPPYSEQHYGESAGQLSAMVEGDVAAVISSPPYETGGHHDHQMDSWNANDGGHGTKKGDAGYGQTEGQLGGDTFWASAKIIVQQCHTILRPGGMAIWITKDFVRKGKRVPFSDQWQALCESQGFKLVCRHRAMLVAHHGEQDDMLGETKQLKTERKSFFRRLAEKKGSPAIDFEDVICLVRA